MKKKGFTLVEMIAVVMIIAIIAVLAVPPVLQAIRGSKTEISDAMKKVIVSASDIYMDADKDNYVRYNGNRYCITIKQLVENERLSNPVYDPTTSKEISQDKFVQIDIFDNEYSYEIVDNCEEIRRHSLVYQLKQQYKEGNTNGLLKDTDGSYYYKGTNEEVSNNFVWFAGHLWRVISINNDDTLTMITQQPLTAISPANMVWGTEQEYKNSYINHWLNDIFLGSMENVDKQKIQENTFNIGVYTNTSNIKINSSIGLLDEAQYKKSGGINKFLDIKIAFWLGNYHDNNSIRCVYRDGSLGYDYLTNTDSLRPVIRISDLVLAEGDGALTNPYREKNKISNIAKAKVGEYISLPTNGNDCGADKQCLFRIVSKDDNSVKVILNGLLPNTSSFGSTTTYISGSAIDNIVTTFANTIDSKYRYTGTDKTFGIEKYVTKGSYTVVQDKTYTGNVGLPVIGEVFSGNDINMTNPLDSNKIFVNVETIENPVVADNFWMMNEYSSTAIYTVYYNGRLISKSPSTSFGVRPVLFLKNNLKFTGGEGTAENPFTLE